MPIWTNCEGSQIIKKGIFVIHESIFNYLTLATFYLVIFTIVDLIPSLFL